MATMDREPRSSGNGLLYVGLVVGIGLVVAGVVMEGMPRSSAPDPIPAVPAPQPVVAAVPPAALPEAPSTPHAWEPTSEPLPIVWLAEVTGGSTAAAGAPCVVALFVARGHNDIVAERVRVECEGRVVLDETISRATVHEVPIGDGWYAYRAHVVESSHGVRLSTETHRVEAAGGALELFVEDMSVPRRWAPFIDANAGWVASMHRRLHRLAVPTHVEGAVPRTIAEAMRSGRPSAADASGTFCELTGSTVPSDRFECRLLLRCGDTNIYGEGTSGYIPCVLADGRVVSATDTNETPVDTDPRVRLDVASSVLEVSDTTDEGAWSARFALEDHPRCASALAWRGTIRYGEGSRYAWTSAPSDDSAVQLLWSGNGLSDAGERVSWTADCASGRIDARTLSVDPGVGPSAYRLWLGPRMRVMAGESGIESDHSGSMWATR